MRKIYFLIILLTGSIHAQSVFINEIHYDNSGADTGEGIEIFGPVGTDLSTYTLLLYNGNGGGVYDSISLNGIITDQVGGFGTLSFFQSGIQNGTPDGIALVNIVDGQPTMVQFLSYEGTLIATDGVAIGLTSTDIGVSEANNTLIGQSLQLIGAGNVYSDFTWQAATESSFGTVNESQDVEIVTLNNPDLLILKNETVLYPNPSVAGLVFLETSLTREIDVVIYNNIGVKVSAQLVSNKEIISTQKLPSGLYFIQLKYKGNTIVKRVVVQ